MTAGLAVARRAALRAKREVTAMADYDRYWELHITGTNGFYDFAPSIRDQQRYQMATHGTKLTGKRLLLNPKDHVRPGIVQRKPIGDKGLPAQGYVASCLTVIDMASGIKDPDDRAIIAWVNDPGHIGKVRVNAHGNGMGQIGMADGAPPDFRVFYRNANEIVSWMVANGLAPVGSPSQKSLAGSKNSRGLITFNLAVCMGARHDKEPATLNYWQTNSTPAPGSAARLIAEALGKAGLKGIEVTASNEITMDGASGVAGQWGRTFGLGGGQAPFTLLRSGDIVAWNIVKTGQGVEIAVPDGWTVSSNLFSVGGTISPPAGYTQWTAVGGTPSAGWQIRNSGGDQIEIPAGWLVDRTAGKIQAPLGFKCVSKGGSRGGTLASIPDAPFTGMGQRLAHSAAKTREIS
jgi:hypothetical protein